MNPERLRCFISIDLPEEIKNISERTQREIKSKGFIDAKYTERNNLHLTLKFLGEIDSLALKKVSDKLKEIKFEKFTVKLESAGVFSQEDEIKIIWYALAGEGLKKLQKTIDEELKEMFLPEKRFMAHITIARTKKVLRKKEILDYLSSLAPDKKVYTIDRFSLKKSIPTSEGSVYETLEEYYAR